MIPLALINDSDERSLKKEAERIIFDATDTCFYFEASFLS
jgi:hypothetical protein